VTGPICRCVNYVYFIELRRNRQSKHRQPCLHSARSNRTTWKQDRIDIARATFLGLRLTESVSGPHTFRGPHKPAFRRRTRCVSSIVRLFDCLPDGPRTHCYCIRSISRSQCDTDQPSKRRPPGQVPSGSNTPPLAQCARPPSIMGMHFLTANRPRAVAPVRVCGRSS
jgi:hypothetical protein